VTTSKLTIGALDAGNIEVGDFSPLGTNTLVLETAGSVTEQGAGDVGADLTVSNLGIHSGTGVDVDIDADVLAVQNDGAGGIDILDTAGGLVVGDVCTLQGATTTGGGISIATQSPLTVNENVTENGAGDIILAALGNQPTDDLTINANVSANGGDIIFAAGDSVIFGNKVDVSAAGDGNVTIAPGENFSDGIFNQDGNPFGESVIPPTVDILVQDGLISFFQAAGLAAQSVATGFAGSLSELEKANTGCSETSDECPNSPFE